jgi:MFS family permease
MIENSIKRKALQFIVIMGIVSLFADMTYEGARSITGPYLALLGASGTIVGVVAGLGELIGYSARSLFGYISDRTGRYWTITMIGYVINLLAVPLLALAGNWPLAVTLIIAERFGKAIRTPAKDAMLSYATKQVGRGWGFGLHEALDQIGAVSGPLIVAVVLYFKGSYSMSFGILLIPALLALATLTLARVLHPNPERLEGGERDLSSEGLNKSYWVYVIGVSLVAAGYVDFPLIAYRFQQDHVFSEAWTPILYAIAMGVDGIAALILGRLFDKKKMNVLILATLFSAFFAPFVFLGGFAGALTGMIIWGIGLGAQESIMRAVVANLVNPGRRATAYGMMNMWFGISWFLGSALMGVLYDISIPALIAFSILFQLIAIPFFMAVKKSEEGR